MIRSLILALVLLAGCNKPGTTSTTPGTLVPTCTVPTDSTLSTFNADGTFPVTARGVSSDGSMAVNLCDGPVFRVMFVQGMRAGDPNQRHGGLFVGSDERLVHHDDLITTSRTAVPADNVKGVTTVCYAAVNCGDIPTPVTNTAPAAPAATTPGAMATVAAPPTVTAPATSNP